MQKHKRKYKICHLAVVHKADDKRIFKRECRSLAKMGYEVHIIAPFEHDGVIENIIIDALPNKIGWFSRIINIFRLSFRAFKIKADIYHFHDPILIYTGFILMQFMKVPVIYDIHENVSDQIMLKSIPRLAKRILKLFYEVTANLLTKGMSKVVVVEGMLKQYRGDVRIIKNFFPISSFDIDSTSDLKIREGVRQRGKSFRLIYMGYVSRERGGVTMIDLVHELSFSYGRNIKLDIFGPFSPSLFEEEVKNRIAKYGLDSHINLHGYQSFNRLVPYLKQADIGLCLLHPYPHYNNSIPVKFFEYMAFGLPIVSSNINCWKPYIEDVGSGIMIDPLNIKESAKIVNSLLMNYEDRIYMGIRGREAVHRYFNWDKEAMKLDSLYRELLGEKLAYMSRDN